MNTRTTPSVRNATGTTPGAKVPAESSDASLIAGGPYAGDSSDYPLVAARDDEKTTIIDVRGVLVGAKSFQLIAGPCAVESRDRLFRIADIVKRGGAKFLRGGAFKPRTSPYSFQGLGEEGLRMLQEASREFDLRIVTEAKDCTTLPAVAEVADVIQIGSRNMQNFSLLEAAGRLRKPVLLKRGMGSRLSELFMAAEYIVAQGNPNVILCERGIRTFETMTRNTFDVGAIAIMKRRTHLPVAADPSHGIGIGWAVPAMARAALAAGADAVMVEVHDDPPHALSDGQQAVTPAEFETLARQLAELSKWMQELPV